MIDYYYKLYKKDFNWPKKSQMNDTECRILAGLIYGDIGFRKPSLKSAKIYKDAGATVYQYFLDIDFEFDYLYQAECKCPTV